MFDHFRTIVTSQFDAALLMLRDCLEKCPDSCWDEPVAKYPFWMVAYHTLCFVDYYLAPSDAEFKTRPDLHPRGMEELDAEYPSRKFSQAELLGYIEICRALVRQVLASEPDERLRAPAGFPRRNFSRAELHLYNMRHVMHHTGQLSALLRRRGVDATWIGVGQ